MKKQLTSISPDSTVECAVATAQEHSVGALPVVDDDVVVGMVTTNDFFYKILNPLLGIRESGRRVIIYGADSPSQVCNVMDVIKEAGVSIKALHTISLPEAKSRDLVVHLETEDASEIIAKLKSLSYHVAEREHQPCTV